MVRRLYTADLHVDHANIIKLSKRPFLDVEEMKNTIITNWNSVVNDGDIVYVLGDICFSVDTFTELVEVLNGQIHIIRGNHDEEAIKRAVNGYKINGVVYHRDILRIKDGKHTVVLSHYPIFEWDRWFSGSFHLHGHVHGNKIGELSNKSRSFRPRAFDVGVDVWDFKPVTLDKILKRQEELTCSECMHYDVCKYSDKINRQQCTYLK